MSGISGRRAHDIEVFGELTCPARPMIGSEAAGMLEIANRMTSDHQPHSLVDLTSQSMQRLSCTVQTLVGRDADPDRHQILDCTCCVNERLRRGVCAEIVHIPAFTPQQICQHRKHESMTLSRRTPDDDDPTSAARPRKARTELPDESGGNRCRKVLHSDVDLSF